MLIGAFYYPWWHDDGTHWKCGYMGKPFLGEYSSKDQKVISKHINWASENGINFFIMSWCGYESGNEFRDETIKNYFLKSKDIEKIKFAILYETKGRLKKDKYEKFNFDNTDNKDKLIEDFKYISKVYFNHPQYLKINKKPMVFIYLARDFNRNYKNAMRELRSEINRERVEMYLMGDMVYWQNPNCQKELIEQFDGITAYNMHKDCSSISEQFVEKVIDNYKYWFNVTSNWDVDFIPNVMPGFDKSAYKSNKKHPVISRKIEDFRHFCKEAKKYLSDNKIITITSWNEWHEYTQIEPDKTCYLEEYLKVIKEL